MNEKREWLIGIRNHLGYTQEKVSELSDVDRSHYALIESGRRNPSVAAAKRISEALKFDWSIFFADNCGNMPQGNKSA